ncbi:MAG TPA: ABC transporter permease [Verrucomicrobiae bacterium]|nr:ABC transporter permease [Verrucomicrobiae bacterium]
MNAAVMRVGRLVAMTWARSLEFLRDRSALGWNVAAPVLMVAGFAVIFSGPGQPLFKVAVVAPPGLALDGQLHPFLATEHVQFYREASLDKVIGKVGRHQVDLLLDLSGTSGRYWINPESAKGEIAEKLLQATDPPLERQEIGGAPIRYVDWVVPGLLGMNMMFSCLFGIGYVIVRYRKSGYLKRLNATPLTALEFLLAQLLSRLALTLMITVFCFVGTTLFLHFRMDGSYLDLFLVTLLAAVSMIALGLIVASRVASEEFAGGILNLITWPMMVLSGVFFSIDGAPRAVQVAADLFPLTHLLTAARAIMLEGTPLSALGYHVGALALMSALFLGLGAWMFRWTQD